MRVDKIELGRRMMLAVAVSVTAAQPLVAQTTPPVDMKVLQQRLVAGMERGLSDVFDRADMNRDGRITQSEALVFVQKFGHEGPLGGSWAAVDMNRDGVATKQEFIGAAMARYNRVQSAGQ